MIPILSCNRIFTYSILLLGLVTPLAAQDKTQPCPRPHPTSEVTPPPELRAINGVLRATARFRTSLDRDGMRLFCYIFDGAGESPTLRLSPGDELLLTLRNELPPDLASAAHSHSMEISGPCGGGKLSATATNLHFHGIHVPPSCHQDDVLSTLVQAGAEGYEYRIRIPANHPPGLYWYHPHPHGFGEAQLIGGASGALIVEGIQRVNPLVAGLPERIFILRDQWNTALSEAAEDAGPGKDLSVNFVPIRYPFSYPANLHVAPGGREFWRVLNASADTYFDVQMRTGPIMQEVIHPQPVEVIALDGSPLPLGAPRFHDDVLLPPGARVEFIATMPPAGTLAQLATLKYETGPDGEATPIRTLINISPVPGQPSLPGLPSVPEPLPAPAGLTNLKPAVSRKLYFSELHRDPNDRSKDSYFITVEGADPKEFAMNFKKPDIVATQGTVEDWTIENRAKEAHAFHVHQLHFQLLARDGKPAYEPNLRDTIDLPFWDGTSPYPSVTLRMDFRGAETVGTFLYHCHILEHEDRGMMGAIRVISPSKKR